MTQYIKWKEILNTIPFANNDTNIHFGNYKNKYNTNQLETLNYFKNFKIVDTIYQDNEAWSLSKTSSQIDNAVHYLTADNFKNGTVRLTKPGYYYLTEDVIFSPDPRGDNSFMPTEEQIQAGDYPTSSTMPTGYYHMGFFAALTIETSGVILNLGGHSIRQSNIHRLQQRFFACIELASAPFRNVIKPTGDIISQGPADFGPTPVVSASNTYIFNGKLNASSHHSIHGTENTNIFLENLLCSNFEVAAIHLNGCVGGVIRNIHITNSANDIQVNATYSQAKFLLPFLEKIVEDHPLTKLEFKNADGSLNREKTASEVLSELKLAMNEVFLAVLENRELPDDINDPNIARANATIFKLENEIIDGNNYGIVLAQSGPVVGAHKLSRDEHNRNEDIVIHDIVIRNILSEPHEILGCSVAIDSDVPYGGNRAVDARGGIIRLTDIMDPIETNGVVKYKYKGNILTNAQILISISDLVNKGRTNIPSELITWVLSGKDNLEDTFIHNDLYFVGLGDSMGHVMKGTKGLFLQGGSNIQLSDINIMGIRNMGNIGFEYSSIFRYIASNEIYRGCMTSGVVIVGSENVTLLGIDVSDIESECGVSNGIECIGENKNVHIGKTSISNIICPKIKNQGSEPNPLIDINNIYVDDASKYNVTIV